MKQENQRRRICRTASLPHYTDKAFSFIDLRLEQIAMIFGVDRLLCANLTND
jgi:hypothetical protein